MNPLLAGAGRYFTAGDRNSAELRLRALTEAEPGNADAWGDLAIIAAEREHFAAANLLVDRAIALSPSDPRLLSLKGNVLHRQQRYREALPYHRRAVQLAEGRSRSDALLNRAITFYEDGRLQESLEDFQSALQLGEDQNWISQICQEMAYPVLAMGDLRQGFALMEHRWNRLLKTQVWDLGVPEWQGEDLRGKTLLVHQDQGFGDAIQFVRFVKDLPCDKPIIVAVSRPLVRLLQGSGYMVVDRECALPLTDYHVPICSLPFRVGSTYENISGRPYLQPPVLRTPVKGNGYRIGLIWSAEKRLTGPRRSMPLELLLPLANAPGVRLYSLQRDGTEDISRLGAHSLIEDMAWAIRDFADLATLMGEMDLIVSADSAPLHLAGALGVPSVLFTDYVRCWRWLRDRDDTPWYDSVRVVSQPQPGDWAPVIERTTEMVHERSNIPVTQAA